MEVLDWVEIMRHILSRHGAEKTASVWGRKQLLKKFAENGLIMYWR